MFSSCYPKRERGVACLLALLPLASTTLGQLGPAPVPQHVESYDVDSGLHDGTGTQTRMAYSTVVVSPDAPWLQIHFADCKLGKESYLLLTSMQDGEQQRLDGKSLEIWQHASAQFKGDSVAVDLYVAQGDAGVSVKIDEITVGEWVGGGPRGGCAWDCGICGGDDRVSSTDPRVGRTGGCTGWIVSNGAYLTAGHCVSPGFTLDTLHFNVPSSNCDGTTNPASVNDQYPVLQASIVWSHTAGEDDWAVFACGPNSNTGLLPVQAQGDFFRMSGELNPADARVTGYGLDASPAGCMGGMNEFSQTQQTHEADFYSNGGASLDIEADVTCGVSGGPVITPDGIVALGIATRCTSNCNLDDNHGTGFANIGLANFIQTFPGPNVVYVDAGHPVVLEDGSVFRPYDRVSEGVSAVPTGGIISIVTGDYPAAAGNTFTAGADGKAMTLVASVGLVRIGN